ncbi:MAG: phosphotriesterase family protein [Acidimicrobiia bacterium]
MTVRTVLGDIPPADLGTTYLHEHLIIDSPFVASRLPHIHLPDPDEAVAELALCQAAGVGAMVDAMPSASGRDVARLAEVSQRSGVHVVASTGLHTEKYYPGHQWAVEPSVDTLTRLFTSEIQTGIERFGPTGPAIEHTTYRAGIIKVATGGATLTDRDRKLFEAAAAAHQVTGAPILTHCEEGEGAPGQVDLLHRLGVPLSRVVLSHTDKITDPGLHAELLSAGVNLEYDQALRQAGDEEPVTARLLAAMIEAGYLGQLMLGTDGARRSLWASLGGGPGLAWLVTGFTEVLASHGIDAAHRRELFVANPANFLSFGAQ